MVVADLSSLNLERGCCQGGLARSTASAICCPLLPHKSLIRKHNARRRRRHLRLDQRVELRLVAATAALIEFAQGWHLDPDGLYIGGAVPGARHRHGHRLAEPKAPRSGQIEVLCPRTLSSRACQLSRSLVRSSARPTPGTRTGYCKTLPQNRNTAGPRTARSQKSKITPVLPPTPTPPETRS